MTNGADVDISSESGDEDAVMQRHIDAYKAEQAKAIVPSPSDLPILRDGATSPIPPPPPPGLFDSSK